MPVSYNKDSLRHFACKCEESSGLTVLHAIASSGLEIPVADTSWSVVMGEPEPPVVDAGVWQHMVGMLVKAKADGLSGRAKSELAAAIADLSMVVSTLNARQSSEVAWAAIEVLPPSDDDIVESEVVESVVVAPAAEPVAPVVEVAVPALPVPEPIVDPIKSEVSEDVGSEASQS